MNELGVEQFDEYFIGLWSRPPFAWQRELARRVLTDKKNPWPEVIALPTASGKTACIDIAVFALAAQAYAAERSAARRIFFVVDRRVIVDEAYERSLKIADKLTNSSDGILNEVADRLCYLACGEHEKADQELPLAVHELRGGMYRSEAWAQTPLQPTIVASTVDQIGSRLLFRAYGRGSGMWPVYAGLVGNDSLIFLDEAHCSQPFMQTLQAVKKYRTWAEAPLATPFYPIVMSATPPAELSDLFRDESGEKDDLGHPLGRRQLARKPAKLLVAEKARGKKAPLLLARDLVNAANELAGDQNKAVAIFCNRVATAREAYRLLKADHGKESVLLTGRMRPIDKDDTVSEQLRRLSSSESEQRNLERPLFVVATQTLEVGADLDFDLLVTECAPLDALRQRFGRLNRMGRPIDARANIIVRADQAENSEDDPVYGQALANTWRWLNEQTDSEREVDFGVSALSACLSDGEKLASMSAPSINAPVMLPAHIDCWVQTSPEPEPTPDVSLFLRGPQRGSADVQVCWRSDLDLTHETLINKSIEALIACPPTAAECVAVPISLMRQWMSGALEDDDSSDITSNERNDVDDEQTEAHQRVIRWPNRNEAMMVNSPDKIRPGDVLILPAKSGGWDKLGDLVPSVNGAPILDWGDRAFAQSRAKPILRLYPEVIRQWPECDSKHAMLEFVCNKPLSYDEAPGEVVDSLRSLLGRLATDEALSKEHWLHRIASSLVNDNQTKIKQHPLDGFIVTGRARINMQAQLANDFSDEDDATASGTVPVLLRNHLPGVASYARRYAKGSGLPEELIHVIEQSGLLHDLGKADPRFQILLNGGIPAVRTEPLAKSSQLPSGAQGFKRAREKAGYPEGGRHELLSVCMAQSVPHILPDDQMRRDLLLHLIASHHGYCRPFAPVVFDESPGKVRFDLDGLTLSHDGETNLERLDSGVSDRFWGLVRHYGWWGLAWLEAMLRLADHRRSEAEAGGDI